MTEAEAPEWVEVARRGPRRLPQVRVVRPGVGLDGRRPGASSGWPSSRRRRTGSRTLAPAHDLFAAGLEDGSLDVRVTALMEVGKLWSWVPGRSLMLPEENALADWKQGLTAPVVRRLGDREPKARAAAVACLGRLPIDAIAAPAVAYLDDPRSPEVRNQVLVSFAGRPSLLSEDTVLKHMYDPEPIIRRVGRDRPEAPRAEPGADQPGEHDLPPQGRRSGRRSSR